MTKYHDAGFQQIKIYSSMKSENVKAVCEDAHKVGMTVTGHIPIGMNAYEGVEDGMDMINHIHYVMPICCFRRMLTGRKLSGRAFRSDGISRH